jgi:RNA polymerase sigma-70 factor (ECF subfamily)
MTRLCRCDGKTAETPAKRSGTRRLADIPKELTMSESGIARSLLLFPGNGAVDDGEPAGADCAAEMVERVSGGDQEAFDELYRKYSPMVHGIILARSPRPEVDDVVQDVFLTVFRKIHTINDPNALGAWIASIARRCAADSYRRSKPFEELPDDLTAGKPAVNEANEILAVIRKMPEAYSETLIMRLVEGMTGPEISDATGLTQDSVRVNLHRGMKMLREKLQGGR